MAKAEKSLIERVVTEEGVVLCLTMKEVYALYAITRLVAGGSNSPRVQTDKILEALRESLGREALHAAAATEVACFERSPGVHALDYPKEAVW
jgi:hypothetical protein